MHSQTCHVGMCPPAQQLWCCQAQEAMFTKSGMLAGALHYRMTLSAEACERAVQKYEPPSGDLAEQIEKDFGSLDKLVADFNPKTAAIQVRSSLPHSAVSTVPCKRLTIISMHGWLHEGHDSAEHLRCACRVRGGAGWAGASLWGSCCMQAPPTRIPWCSRCAPRSCFCAFL